MGLQNVYKTRVLVVSPFVQAAFGAALADASLIHRPRIDVNSFASLTKQFFSDADMGNKGHAFPTMRQETQRDTGLQMSMPLTDWMAGYLAGLVLGKVTTTPGAPGIYSHAFVFDPVAGEPKFTTVYCEDTADLKYKLSDMAVAELTISGSESGVVQAQFSMLGSGKHLDGAMVAPVLPATPTFLLCSDATIKWGAAGAAAEVTGDRIKSWQVKFSQDIALVRGPGSGLYAGSMEIGSPRVTTQFAIKAIEADDVKAAFMGNTEQELQITVDSGEKAKLDIHFESIYLSAAQLGADGKAEIWSVESDENSILKEEGAEFVTVTVTNGQETYLTQPA